MYVFDINFSVTYGTWYPLMVYEVNVSNVFVIYLIAIFVCRLTSDSSTTNFPGMQAHLFRIRTHYWYFKWDHICMYQRIKKEKLIVRYHFVAAMYTYSTHDHTKFREYIMLFNKSWTFAILIESFVIVQTYLKLLRFMHIY